jgi:hypothetical protein
MSVKPIANDQKNKEFGNSEIVVIWVPVTTAWYILGLQMEETASRYGG